MLKIELYNHDAIDDPPANFSTDAEIEIADELRHQLEERYLAPSAPLPVRPGKDHCFVPTNAACGVARVLGSGEQLEA